jgi:hypothetical protein
MFRILLYFGIGTPKDKINAFKKRIEYTPEQSLRTTPNYTTHKSL